MRSISSVAIVLTLLAATTGTARADDAPPAAPPPLAPAPPPCGLATTAGVDPVDAETAAELVCAEVKPSAGERWGVRLARIERKVVFGVTRTLPNGSTTERHLVLSGLDEVPTAAPRLVESIAEEKSPAETQTVENIVGEEARVPKRKAGEIHPWLGVDAVGFLGDTSQARGGVCMGVAFGSAANVFVLDGRLIGESLMAPLSAAAAIFSLGLLYDANRKPVDGALGTGSAGFRHYFGLGDTATFAGGGLGLAYMRETTDSGISVSGTGVMPYAAAGVELMRTRTVGGLVGARVDAPLFGLEGQQSGTNGAPTKTAHTHPMVASLFVAARL